MSGTLEVFLVAAEPDQAAGIGILMKHVEIVEEDGELAPGCLLTRAQALELAYQLGVLAEQLPE